MKRARWSEKPPAKRVIAAANCCIRLCTYIYLIRRATSSCKNGR